jgi:hypothetical protein
MFSENCFGKDTWKELAWLKFRHYLHLPQESEGIQEEPETKLHVVTFHVVTAARTSQSRQPVSELRAGALQNTKQCALPSL